MEILDKQMIHWSTRLRDDLNIGVHESNTLATTISGEVRALPSDTKKRIRDASVIPLQARLKELEAFQDWMDLVRQSEVPAGRFGRALLRAQVITQNYICFVYLKDACFKIIKENAPPHSVVARCCEFLTDKNGKVYKFRNAVAHSDWTDAPRIPDSTGHALECWDGPPNKPKNRFVVTELELNFWQSLARCTAYAIYVTLCDGAGN